MTFGRVLSEVELNEEFQCVSRLHDTRHYRQDKVAIIVKVDAGSMIDGVMHAFVVSASRISDIRIQGTERVNPLCQRGEEGGGYRNGDLARFPRWNAHPVFPSIDYRPS